jgi:hypothetical protein
MSLIPGKGAHLTMTPDMIDWLKETVDHVHDYWPAEIELEDGVFTRKTAGALLKSIANSMNGWKVVNDNFGLKVYRAYEWDTGEIRVTLVRPKAKAGEGDDSNVDVKLDIRYWFDPNAA